MRPRVGLEDLRVKHAPDLRLLRLARHVSATEHRCRIGRGH